jgi:hypothetical protein
MLETWTPPQDEFVGTISTGNRTVERYAGHKALWMRVIIRAAFDLASYKDDRRVALRKYADNAHKWLFEKSLLFNSFENICAMLGLPPEPIREWASTLTKEDVQKMEHLERGGVKDVQLLLSRRVEIEDVED